MANKNKPSRSDKILSWLLDHPLVSRSALCDKIGYDRGSLEQALKGGRSIPAKYLAPLEKELEKYGYKK